MNVFHSTSTWAFTGTDHTHNVYALPSSLLLKKKAFEQSHSEKPVFKEMEVDKKKGGRGGNPPRIAIIRTRKHSKRTPDRKIACTPTHSPSQR